MPKAASPWAPNWAAVDIRAREPKVRVACSMEAGMPIAKARFMWPRSGLKCAGFRCSAERPVRMCCRPSARARTCAVTVAIAAPATPQCRRKMNTGSSAALTSTLANMTRKANRTSPTACNMPWMAMKPNRGTMPR